MDPKLNLLYKLGPYLVMNVEFPFPPVSFTKAKGPLASSKQVCEVTAVSLITMLYIYHVPTDQWGGASPKEGRD